MNVSAQYYTSEKACPVNASNYVKSLSKSRPDKFPRHPSKAINVAVEKPIVQYEYFACPFLLCR